MLLLDRYRRLYEYEKDCNAKMLGMVATVPEAQRGDARFQQAVTLCCHLAACRENWLDRIGGNGSHQVPWWEPSCDFATLEPRFAALEARWTDFLAQLDDAELTEDFKFSTRDGKEYQFPVEVQVVQLLSHTCYHRGQISLLVDQLGGVTVDTDYLYWAVAF